MALGFEFLLLQIAISIIGYIVHQFFNFPIERVLLAATVISIIAPFLMLDVSTADLSLLTAMIQNTVSVLPEQFVGLIIGSVVTGVIHGIRMILAHFDIEFG